MQSIQHTMKSLKGKYNFQEQYGELKQEVLSNPHVRWFLDHHKGDISEQVIDRSIGKLYEYTNQSVHCQDCHSFEGCKNMLKGYAPVLFFDGQVIHVRYEPCEKKQRFDEKKKQHSLVKSMYIPKDILSASMNNLYPGTGRLKAIEQALQFIKDYEKETFLKGLYFYGPFGVGKTYLLGAIANELVKKGVQSLIVYAPEFFREMKGSIQDHTLQEKIDYIKKVPVLMLDDIGAESMSSWIRDEVIGTILQFRMMEKLPTFFTSNVDYKELEHHLTYSQRGEVEELKAARVMERIRFLTNPIKLTGINFRHTDQA